MSLQLGTGGTGLALGGRRGKQLVQVRPGAPGSRQHPAGAQRAAGRPTAWGWLDRQRGNRLASSLWLLTHFSCCPSQGLRMKVSFSQQWDGDPKMETRGNKGAFPNMLAVPSLRRSPRDTRAQVSVLLLLMSNPGPGSAPL